MVVIRSLRFNEWIRPLRLSAHILDHTPQPWRTLLLLKLPLSLLVLKIYDLETIYVAEEDEVIVGICLAQVKNGELVIEGTVVDEKHRRRGISNALKRVVEAKAVELGVRKAVTKIEESNDSALRMAESQGYHAISESNVFEKDLS